MSDAKSKPIPTRYDEEDLETIERLHDATGLPKAEIVRRAVNFALQHARRTKSINFLLGEEDRINQILSDSPGSPEDSKE